MSNSYLFLYVKVLISLLNIVFFRIGIFWGKMTPGAKKKKFCFFVVFLNFLFICFLFCRNQMFSPNCVLYVNVLISLLNIVFFRLGDFFLKMTPGAKKKKFCFFCFVLFSIYFFTFVQKPNVQSNFCSLCKCAHFLTKH